MCFVYSLVPATIFVVIGYFVLFSSKKAESTISKFGFILAIWIFVVAAFFPVCGAYMTLSGQCPMEKMMQRMEMPADLTEGNVTYRHINLLVDPDTPSRQAKKS